MKNISFKKNVIKNIKQFPNNYKKSSKIFYLFIIIIFLYYDEKIYYSNPIKVAYYCISFKNSGVERVISLLLGYLSKEKRLTNYLITIKGKSEGEYTLNQNVKRISLSEERISIIKAIKTNHIDVLIYNFYNIKEIRKLNKLKTTKVIYYDHSSYFYWLYKNIYNFKDSIYYEYKNCKYIISLIPLENDYLFKKWGIKSILMDNPTTFQIESIIPSDLTKKNVIMIGRADDALKRFDLGIKAMEIIIKEIPDCEMNIISFPKKKYKKLIKN